MGNEILIIKELLNDVGDGLALACLTLFISSKIFKNRLKIPFENIWNRTFMIAWLFAFLLFRLLRYLDFSKNRNLIIFELIFLSIGIYVSKDLFEKQGFTKVIQIMFILFFIKMAL